MASNTASELVEPAAKPVLVLYPPSGWQLLNLRELWQSRDLVYFLVWRDVKVRYKQTVLGAAWAVLQPAMMMAIFTIFFSRMAGVPTGGLPYPLFAFAGLLPWTFFATAIASARIPTTTPRPIAMTAILPNATGGLVWRPAGSGRTRDPPPVVARRFRSDGCRG